MKLVPHASEPSFVDAHLNNPGESVHIADAMHGAGTVERYLGFQGYSWMGIITTPLNERPLSKYFADTAAAQQKPATFHIFKNRTDDYLPSPAESSKARPADWRDVKDTMAYEPGDLAVVDDETLMKLQLLGRINPKNYEKAFNDPDSAYYRGRFRVARIAARSGSIILGRSGRTHPAFVGLLDDVSHMSISRRHVQISTANDVITVTNLGKNGTKATYQPGD